MAAVPAPIPNSEQAELQDASAASLEAPEAGASQLEAAAAVAETEPAEKWPGWPGHNVYRLIVPVQKVGSIIGRKGELVRSMCDETSARIRVLEGPLGTSDRVVLISGKEELQSPLPPAMDAVLRVFKRVNSLPLGEGDIGSAAAGTAFCSIKLLVASSQAINLIGKQGSTIKSIQESTGASVRVLGEDELPSYATSEERIIELQGEAIKVLKALEAVIGHLRKFLVDQSVIPIFEKTYNETIKQERSADKIQPSLHSAPAPSLQSAPASQSGISSDYFLSLKRDSLLYERESHMDAKIAQSGLSLYGQDPELVGLRPTGLGRPSAPIVTQMAQTMQVPLSYAEDIIGVRGSNIAYIRHTSGAILTIQESGGLPDEITVEIKGTTSQVQMAQQLIQEFISNHKEPLPSAYGKMDAGYSAYSQVAEPGYSSSSFPSHLGGYGSPGAGGYRSPGIGGGYGSYRY